MTASKRDDDPGRLKVGDRVQLSSLGRRHPRIVNREGVIVGVYKTGTRFHVLWDGLKRPAVYHHSYLERASARGGAAGFGANTIDDGGPEKDETAERAAVELSASPVQPSRGRLT